MNKYDTYKDSGIEWIGEIPSHWEVKKVNYCFEQIGSGTTPTAGKPEYYENGQFNWLQTGDLNDADISETSKKITQKALNDYSTLRFYQKDSLVIAMYGATIGKTGLLNIETTTNQACCVLSKPKGINHRFAFYWLNYVKPHVISLSYGGGQPNINQEQIRSLKIQCPTLEEQTAIAAYLDRKTAEIDELIADKKRLLELYEEEKTGIINQAVTKGINPDVPMKDSGIEWLGEIPEHWEVKRLKTIARVQTGRTPKIQNSKIDFFENGEINWFTPSDFNGNTELTESKRKLIFEAFETGEVELFPENSIYLVSIGATLGKVSFFRDKASANQQINIIIFSQAFSPIFGYYFLVGNKEMITLEADYTTLPILNQSKTKSLSFAVPPIQEQQSIVRHIETECARIDAKKSKTEKLIALLTEYRTALISEVVTGKVKVIDQ
jgi:type I restriction enzyme S subunit